MRYVGELFIVFWYDVEESDYVFYFYVKLDMNELKKFFLINDGEMFDNLLENEIIEIFKESDKAFIEFFKFRNFIEEIFELRILWDYE